MASILNYDWSGEDAENQVVSSLSVPSIFNLPFKIPFSMKANHHSTCQIKTSKKKRRAPLEMNPPLSCPPAAAANHTVRQLHLFSSQHSSYRCLSGCSCGPMNPAGNESAQGGMLGHVALLLRISFA